MSRDEFDVREEYIGAGNLDTYSFDFKIEALSQLLVVEYDDTGVETQRVRGDDTTYLSSVTFNDDGGGTVVLAADLTTDYKLVLLLANDAPTQPYTFRNRADFTLSRLSAAFDWIAGAVQRVAYLGQRSIRLNDHDDVAAFDMAMPANASDNPKATIIVNEDGDGIDFGLTTDQILAAQSAAEAAQAAAAAAQAGAEAAAGSAEDAQAAAEQAALDAGVPDGGDTGAVLVKTSPADADTEWAQMAFDGYSSRFSAIFTSTSLLDTLTKIINIVYTAPAVTLTASGSTTVREKGTAVTAVNLSAAITKRSDPIAAVRYYKGATLIETEAAPNPAGGTETYSWSGSFSDNETFSVEVDDDGSTGGPTTVTDTRTFTFVYPYFVGAGAAGLSAANVALLTKLTQVSTATVNRTITAAGGEVLFFAYPASYGALASILDVNGFETLPDWTLRTENITALDTSTVSYRIYEFNNPVVAGDYYYSFRR